MGRTTTGVNHAERRRLIVTKALSLFARMGYSKVSFLTISEATGIARTALYRYFRTKRDIFDEAIHEETSALADELQSIRGKDMPAARRIEQCCSIVMSAICDKRDFFRAISDFVFSMVRTGEDMTSRIAQFTGGFGVVLRALIAEGASSGEFRANVDPDSAAEALFALMESFAFRVILGVESDTAAARERFKAMIYALKA